MTPDELKSFLDFKAEQYENTDFIETDPIQIPHRFSKKVQLMGGNRVADAGDVVEHPSNMFISDAFFLDSCDRDVKDLADAAVEENFELVGKGFAHGPGFASP